MKQKYTFFDEGTIEFDDTKSVKELIEYAFDEFDYYESAGMEVVTLFQAHHPDTDTGWFTTDVAASCADEIRNPAELFFAYHIPDVFYFAEGGWGHRMPKLGNHPEIPNAVSLKIQFEDFDHTVVINGKYTFNDIIRFLKETEYIDDSCSSVEAVPVGCASKSYKIPFSDAIMSESLSDFENTLEKYHAERISLDKGESIYHTILRIC